MSNPTRAQDIVQTYKGVFLKGLGTVLPTLVTLWIVFATSDFVARTIAAPIADGIKTQLVESEGGNEVCFRVWKSLGVLRKPKPRPAPAGATEVAKARFAAAEATRLEGLEPSRRADLRKELDLRFPKWVGVALAVIAVFLVGFFMASFLGSSAWGLVEGWLSRIPLVKNIYPAAKQMVSFFLSGDESAGWQAVVAVEFPRKGLWSVGFLTCENIPEIEAESGERVRGVYLGTPAAGQVVLARESEIVAVDMTVDEALKFLMSGGVIGRDPARPPGTQKLPWEETSGDASS
ncbi:MAG: DUF502 domain-containing protein [Planctomycetes bacterium]|nr:DUF502 domain-containing protein [Planctomycetota bacterium]